MLYPFIAVAIELIFMRFRVFTKASPASFTIAYIHYIVVNAYYQIVLSSIIIAMGYLRLLQSIQVNRHLIGQCGCALVGVVGLVQRRGLAARRHHGTLCCCWILSRLHKYLGTNILFIYLFNNNNNNNLSTTAITTTLLLLPLLLLPPATSILLPRPPILLLAPPPPISLQHCGK